MPNFLRYCLIHNLYTAAILLTSGAILQNYLHQIGLSVEYVGIILTFVNIVNIVISMVFSNISDKRNNPIKWTAYMLLPMSIMPIVLFVFCYFKNLSMTTTFIIILISYGVQTFCIALRDIFGYKLPYDIIPFEKFSLSMTINGMVAGIVGVGISLLIASLQKLIPYAYLMSGAFIISVLFFLAAFHLNKHYKKIVGNDSLKNMIATKKISLFVLIKVPSFWKYILPNVFRGLATGVLLMATTLGLSSGKLNNANVIYLIAASSLAAIAGSGLYAFLGMKISHNKLCLLGGILMLAMPFMVMGNFVNFILMYFVAYLGMTITDYSIPLIVYKMIPYHMIASYNTWRMVITTGGTALSSMLTGYLIGIAPVRYILMAASIFQVICVAAYFISGNKKLRAKADNNNT